MRWLAQQTNRRRLGKYPLLAASLFEQEFLIKNLTVSRAHFVNSTELNCIFRAGFFTQSTKATPQKINFKLHWILLFVRSFTCFNLDTHSRAYRGTKQTCSTL